jgi:integrase
VIIKQLLKWAKSRKLIQENPLAEIKLGKPPLVPKGGPSPDQVDQIVGAFDGSARTMVAVLAFTGMRSGELQRLRPEDLDLRGNWIHSRSRRGHETKTREDRGTNGGCRSAGHERKRACIRRLFSCGEGGTLQNP